MLSIRDHSSGTANDAQSAHCRDGPTGAIDPGLIAGGTQVDGFMIVIVRIG